MLWLFVQPTGVYFAHLSLTKKRVLGPVPNLCFFKNSLIFKVSTLNKVQFGGLVHFSPERGLHPTTMSG